MRYKLFKNIYTQEEMSDVYKPLKTKEKTYKKKSLFFDFEIADEEKEIKTIINGKVETTNTAYKGDYILTGSKGEKYILKPEKFNNRYIIKGDKAKTKPAQTKAKEWNRGDLEFMAEWGEKMIIENGDFLINNNGEFYRIEKEAFHNT
jgi:hypothetical protein